MHRLVLIAVMQYLGVARPYITLRLGCAQLVIKLRQSVSAGTCTCISSSIELVRSEIEAE